MPDDIARHRLAKYLGLSEKNTFSLLEVIGGECAGALALYPEGTPPQVPTYGDVEILDDYQLTEILTLLKRRPLLAGSDNVRLSLAGAQDKIAVTLVNDSIALVKGTTPTTHILKPIIEDIKDSIHNELFCLRLARRVGIETPNAEIRWAGETPYYLIERYDRTLNEQNQIIRLHQEDFCQALGILPEFKYEREGGPGISACLSLLHNQSQRPAIDRMTFLKRIIVNFLLGNSDAHGKNFSLLYVDKKPTLAPAYDLLSTTIYPNLSRKMAMKIGGYYDPELICLRHWLQLVPDTSVSKKSFTADLKMLATQVYTEALDLKKSFEDQGLPSPILEEICAVVKHRSQQILRELET